MGGLFPCSIRDCPGIECAKRTTRTTTSTASRTNSASGAGSNPTGGSSIEPKYDKLFHGQPRNANLGGGGSVLLPFAFIHRSAHKSNSAKFADGAPPETGARTSA